MRKEIEKSLCTICGSMHMLRCGWRWDRPGSSLTCRSC